MNDREFIALENAFKDELEKFKDACQVFGVEPSARITDCLFNFEIYLNSHPIQNSIAHPDDLAIDNFAQAMKEKMAKQRAKGYSGWNDKSACSEQKLRGQLLHHITKGDPVDVGNFAMMLFNRGENTNREKYDTDPNALELMGGLNGKEEECSADRDWNYLCAEKLLQLHLIEGALPHLKKYREANTGEVYEIEVTIDIASLLRSAIYSAVRTKSGKAVHHNGAVTATVIAGRLIGKNGQSPSLVAID